jgi:hypothetical protein
MKRLLSRAATLALTIPFATVAVAGAAQAQSVTVPGCYGAGSNENIVCNLTFTAETPGVAIGVFYVKACAGECYNVPVQSVGTTTGAQLCYDYQDGAGTPHHGCASDWLNVGINQSVADVVVGLLGCGSAVCTYY